MAWKGVHLTKAGRLSLADGQCCVKQDEGEVRIAIEDLAWIVIDTPQATVTSALLAACMDAGVAVEKHQEVRFVWLFVFFDLAVGTKADRRRATRFRKFLKDDGFLMLQLSVYARVCRGEDAADKHGQRVTKNLPPRGSVRTLQVTGRQYARIKLLLGETMPSGTKAPQQLVLL